MPATILTIPPGAPFLATFARALCDGDIIPGLSGADPLALAAATIYVPTRRAARALAQELAVALDRPAVLLPRIRPLGGLEETGRGLMFAGGEPLALPPPIGDIERRMLLAELVLHWGRSLRHAIVRIGPGGTPETDPSEALMVATHFAGAWHLAGELAALMDELIIEDVAWKKLDDLGGSFDEYWRITLNFLDIAITHWPEILKTRGKIDPARHQVRLVEAQVAALEAGRETGPVIAIGSTGTNRATARLLAAIARAPKGAVVLPGLDQMLDNRSFDLIGGGDAAMLDPASGHPQAALRRLLPVLGVTREDVRSLGQVRPELAARTRFLSQALRPADTTELWGAWLASSAAEIPGALAGITLIEAADEREEALALAIAMRRVLETPKATAALVTPNRDLAARVRAELLRWQIEVDDSGGEVLGVTPHGALARLALACAESRHGAMDMIALLAHPLVTLARPRAEVARLAPLVEAGMLRVTLPTLAFADTAELVEAARERAEEHHANPAQKRITDAQWEAMEALLTAFSAALAPLDHLAGEAPMADWLAAHRATLLALAAPAPEQAVPGGTDAETLAQLLDDLEQAATPAITFDCAGYRSFFEALSRQTIVRGPQRSHPRVKILGLLEARLIHADVMLLAGLDETVWPPQAQTDAFLNRTMRAQLGLSSPERRIGQTAHDFVEAVCGGDVVLSRAAKRGGSPMVESRFLQRMAALAGGHWQACRARGQGLLHLARTIDLPHHYPPPKRPEPRPSITFRPVKLSVTQIETLRRDPYAIFARTILGLEPLDPLGPELGAREMGQFLHQVLAQFCLAHPKGELPAGVRPQLVEMAREAMQPLLANATFRAFQWPRVETALDYYLAFEADRRGTIAEIFPEKHGKLAITLDDGSIFTLTGTADRLELGRDGSVQVVDFKTGAVPGLEEVRVGFAPQLTLEAMMVDCGSFPALPEGSHATGALYLKLGGGDEGGKIRPLRWKDASFGDVVADHYQELNVLLNQFRQVQTPYLSRPHVKFVTRFSAYDHLARVKEWSGQPGDEA